MLYDVFTELSNKYGEEVAVRILKPVFEDWYVPVPTDTVRLGFLTKPFEVIRNTVQDKSQAVELLDRFQRPYVENQPRADRLWFYHHEDSELNRFYSSVRMYSFRTSPPSWVYFDGYVDITSAKGYAQSYLVQELKFAPKRIQQDPWQFVNGTKLISTKPCRFKVEYDVSSRFNAAILRFKLAGIPYIEINSVTAAGLELLHKRLLLSDEALIVFGPIEQERVVVDQMVPEHLFQHRLTPFTVQAQDLTLLLRRYNPSFTFEQTVPAEYEYYDVSILTYEPADTQTTTRIYSGQELVATLNGSVEYTVSNPQGYLRVRIDQTGSEYSTALLRRVFIGGRSV